MINAIKKTKNNTEEKLTREQIKARYEFEEKFYELMFELGLENRFKNTFTLNIIRETQYGYDARIYIKNGLSFEDLKKHQGTIQENLQCIWIMRTYPFENYAYVKIITQSIDENFEYEAPKLKPWEMYMGLDFSQNVIKNNNNDHCMFLLAGAIGAGKTRFLYQILLSWILGCKPNQVELYISDIAKNEFVPFKDVVHTRMYASELEELAKMMKVIKNKIFQRKNIISKAREKGLATNIEEYNKIEENKGNKLSYCYVVIDEFSVVVPDKSDTKEEKEMKELIIDTLKRISKIGRSLGIFCLLSTQKTTKDEIPSVLKNMSAVRISFRANDSISSEVIMGDNSAMGLGNRIAVYSINGGEQKEYLFSPYISTEMVNKMLEPYINHNRKNKSKKYSEARIEKLRVIPIKPIFKGEDKNKDKENIIRNYIDISEGDDYIDY